MTWHERSEVNFPFTVHVTRCHTHLLYTHLKCVKPFPVYFRVVQFWLFSVNFYLLLKSESKKLGATHSNIQLDKTDSKQSGSTGSRTEGETSPGPTVVVRKGRNIWSSAAHTVMHFDRFTDTMTRFWSMNEMFGWVNIFVRRVIDLSVTTRSAQCESSAMLES